MVASTTVDWKNFCPAGMHYLKYDIRKCMYICMYVYMYVQVGVCKYLLWVIALLFHESAHLLTLEL